MFTFDLFHPSVRTGPFTDGKKQGQKGYQGSLSMNNREYSCEIGALIGCSWAEVINCSLSLYFSYTEYESRIQTIPIHNTELNRKKCTELKVQRIFIEAKNVSRMKILEERKFTFFSFCWFKTGFKLKLLMVFVLWGYNNHIFLLFYGFQ